MAKDDATPAAAKNAGGRPQKNFDPDQFEKLCGIMMTEAEICAWFQTTDKTLNRWCKRVYGKGFSEVYKELSVAGKMSLRRKLFEQAKAGNTAALLFSCKALLGMRENPVDPEERKLRLSILKLQEEMNAMKLQLIGGSAGDAGGKQVIIINDTLPGAEIGQDGDPDQQPDNT